MSHKDSLTWGPIEMKPCDGLRFTCITHLYQALLCAVCLSHRVNNLSRESASTRGNIFYQYPQSHNGGA